MPRRQNSTSSSDSTGGLRSSIKRKGSQKRTKSRANQTNNGEKRLSRRLSEKQSKWLGAKNTLREMLKQSGQLLRFREFLENEFSQENLDFWLAAEEYRKMNPGAERDDKAKSIYDRYIKCNAPQQVNLTYTTQRSVTEKMKDIDGDVFADASREIYKLIELDSYRRFTEKLVV